MMASISLFSSKQLQSELGIDDFTFSVFLAELEADMIVAVDDEDGVRYLNPLFMQ